MRKSIPGFITLLTTAVFAGPAPAATEGQPGILTPETLAGNNPATGAPWAAGDTYRLAFITGSTTTAGSSDISTYNACLQGLADASSLNIGADDGVTWNVIGPITLPVGQAVRIEWCFKGFGGISDDFIGWYIDKGTIKATP